MRPTLLEPDSAAVVSAAAAIAVAAAAIVAAAVSAAAAQKYDDDNDPPQAGAVISGIEAHFIHLTCVPLHYSMRRRQRWKLAFGKNFLSGEPDQ